MKGMGRVFRSLKTFRWVHGDAVVNAGHCDTRSDISAIYSARDLGFAPVIVKCQNNEVLSGNAQLEIRSTEKFVGVFSPNSGRGGGEKSCRDKGISALVLM